MSSIFKLFHALSADYYFIAKNSEFILVYKFFMGKNSKQNKRILSDPAINKKTKNLAKSSDEAVAQIKTNTDVNNILASKMNTESTNRLISNTSINKETKKSLKISESKIDQDIKLRKKDQNKIEKARQNGISKSNKKYQSCQNPELDTNHIVTATKSRHALWIFWIFLITVTSGIFISYNYRPDIIEDLQSQFIENFAKIDFKMLYKYFNSYFAVNPAQDLQSVAHDHENISLSENNKKKLDDLMILENSFTNEDIHKEDVILDLKNIETYSKVIGNEEEKQIVTEMNENIHLHEKIKIAPMNEILNTADHLEMQNIYKDSNYLEKNFQDVIQKNDEINLKQVTDEIDAYIIKDEFNVDSLEKQISNAAHILDNGYKLEESNLKSINNKNHNLENQYNNKNFIHESFIKQSIEQRDNKENILDDKNGKANKENFNDNGYNIQSEKVEINNAILSELNSKNEYTIIKNKMNQNKEGFFKDSLEPFVLDLNIKNLGIIDEEVDFEIDKINAFSMENGREAVHYYHDKLLQTPDDIIFSFGKARSLTIVAENEDNPSLLAESIEHYLKIMSFNPTLKKYMFLAAKYCLLLVNKAGQENLIEKIGETLLKAHPENSDIILNIGVELMNENRIMESKALLEWIISKNPENVEAKFILGYIYEIHFKDSKNAKNLMLPNFEKVNTNSLQLFNALSAALYSLNEKQLATKIYKRAVELDLIPSINQRPMIWFRHILSYPWWAEEDSIHISKPFIDTLTKNWYSVLEEVQYLATEKDFADNIKDVKFYVFYNEDKMTDTCELFPSTCKLLFENLTQCSYCSAAIKIVRGDAQIRPTCSISNEYLMYEIALFVDYIDQMRVLNVAKVYKNGSSFIYDPSFEHQLKLSGNTDFNRIFLNVRMKHPDAI